MESRASPPDQIREARLPSESSLHSTHPYSPRYTKRPPTMVAITLPVSCQPSNGEFRDSDRDFDTSNVQRFFGSKIVTSAWLPRANEPRREQFHNARQRNLVFAMKPGNREP